MGASSGMLHSLVRKGERKSHRNRFSRGRTQHRSWELVWYGRLAEYGNSFILPCWRRTKGHLLKSISLLTMDANSHSGPSGLEHIDEAENEARMLRGELYHAFRPKLTAKRNRCHHACHRFNAAGEASRRRLVELWRE